MADHSPAPRLFDIVEAAERIRDLTDGRTSEEFETNWRDRLAIERCLEIISEASRHLPVSIKDRHPSIEWRKIAGIGNVLRHDYERISIGIVWDVIIRHLPSLHDVCAQELALARGQPWEC